MLLFLLAWFLLSVPLGILLGCSIKEGSRCDV